MEKCIHLMFFIIYLINYLKLKQSAFKVQNSSFPHGQCKIILLLTQNNLPVVLVKCCNLFSSNRRQRKMFSSTESRVHTHLHRAHCLQCAHKPLYCLSFLTVKSCQVEYAYFKKKHGIFPCCQAMLWSKMFIKKLRKPGNN